MRENLLTFVLLAAPFCAAAQDSSRVTTLREVVVSASRNEQALIEIPRSVTVIHQDVLQRSVYQSLGDLLNAHSGLYVVGAGQTPGTNQNVFLRGASSNQVAILVDGVRITDPSTPNAAMDLSEISLANIERVEVIRGSHSTMFGGAAIGGVINLITKKGSREGFHGTASLQGGHFGKNAWSSTENISLQYGRNGFYANGSVFQQDVSGMDAAERSKTNPSFTADRDDFQKTDASMKVGLINEVWDASVSFKNSHQYTEIDNGAFSDDENSYLRFDRKFADYHAGYKINSLLQLSLVGSFSNSERFYENDSSRVDAMTYDRLYSTGTYFGKLQTHEMQLNYEGQRFTAVLGGGLYMEKMFFNNYFLYNDPTYPFESSTNYDSLDTRTTTRYGLVQLQYGAGNLRLSGGARISHHTKAGNVITFEINPSFAYQDLLVYGSLSTGFNAPSLYQLYDPSRSFSSYTTRGNPDLEPEKSISLEAGLKKEFSTGAYVTFSAYHTKVTDAIEYVFLWNGAKPAAELDFTDDRGDTYVNVGEQLARGLEVETFLQVRPRLSFQANMSLLKTQIRAEAENVSPGRTGGHHVQLYNLGKFLIGDVEQNDLVRRPDFTAFTRLRYSLADELTASATYQYTGKRFDSGYDGTLGPYGALARIEVQSYHLLGAGVEWRVTKATGVAIQIENVLNEDYLEVVGFQTRGRSFYLKVTASW